MYSVYFLKSSLNEDLYVGSCRDLAVRIEMHNKGYVRSTKAYRPWKLVGHEEYETRSEAMQREYFLKTGQQKRLLKERFKDL